jgi:IS1 family transposase
MNQLPLAKRAAILRCLVEGSSLRATARLTGTSLNTVTKLLVDLGEMCALYQHHTVRNVQCRLVQCDEIWAFVGAKEKQVKSGAKGEGDTWTWTAMDADSKLMISWLVGRRNARTAVRFLRDLRNRLANRVQLTTDGHHVYLGAVESAFGWNRVDYAMLVKLYGRAGETDRAYSPPGCIGAIKQHVMGNPDPALVSTSYVERANLTMRMGMRRFTRLTNAFSKKLANHCHSVAVHFMWYNFARPHTTLTKAHPRH